MRRRLLALAAVVAIGAAVVAVVLVGRDDGKPHRSVDAHAETLAFAPRTAPAIVAVDTGAPGVGLILQELAPRLTAGALIASDARTLLGREATVALLDPRGRRGQVSLVPRDPRDLDALTGRLRRTGSHRGATLYAGARGGTVAVRGPAVVAGPDAAAVRRALDARSERHAHLTPRAFDARLGDLPRPAGVRAVFDPRALLAAQEPGIFRTRWGRALRGGAAVLTSARDGIRVPFRIATNAAALTDADLPFGSGARPPVARGRAAVALGVRRPDRLIALLRAADPDRFGGIDRLQDGLPGFLRVDVDGLLAGLRNDATITSDLRRLTLRTDPRDADAWRTPIERLGALSDLLQRLGIDDIELDEEPGDVYRLAVDGRLVVRAGVFGPTLVATNDRRANLRRVATAPRAPTPPGAAGGLTVRVQAPTVRAWLKRTFALPTEASPLVTRVRDLTGWARAERDGVRGELRLGVG